MKHLVVVNPISFNKKAEMTAVIRDINAYFDRDDNKDIDYYIYISRYPRDAVSVIKKYIGKTKDTVRVYSVGGDGIMFDCLNGIVTFENAELAVIPYGISNDFVRAFGENAAHVFRDIEKQVKAETIPTDVINVGGKHSLNFCAVGVEAASVLKYYGICRKYPDIAKKIGKPLFVVGAPLALMDKKLVHQEYEVTIDGVNYNGRYCTINIANNPCYGGNKTPAPMAHPADGFLDIILAKSISRLRLLSVIYDYTKGKYYKYPGIFKYIRGTEVSIRSQSPLQINTDGESYYDARLDAKIIPSAVKIAAPDGLKYVRRRELL
ncbi:MAG: hypothetical protein FWE24_05920 [Defluviitaleaceae bacterium]|nr:hypothetical protein [Defluviitaleaceae bacterium]